MNNIIQTIEKKDIILKAEHEVFCPQCNEKVFSPFDKLYVETYGICVDCEDEKLIEKKSKNIFKIL